jgi:hypothetical protein
MGAPIHPVVKKRARELWEKEGYSPEQILDALSLERMKGAFNGLVSDDSKLRLPQDRTTLYNWAKQEGWGDWRETKRKVDEKIEQDIAAGVPFAISSIKDPIWHLAIVEAQRYIKNLKPPFLAFLLRKGYSLSQIREAALTNQELDFSVDDGFDLDQAFLHSGNYDLGNSDQELTAAAVAHVNDVLRPGPRVMLRLWPVIQYELKKVRELYRWFENFTPDGDNPPYPGDTFAEWVRNASEVWEDRLKDKGEEET